MTRKEIIKGIIKDQDRLKGLKRASRKFADGSIVGAKPFKIDANKAELPEDTEDIIYRTIIANTYNYMDSHGDVHLNGTFTKSIKENKNQLYLKDHKMSVDHIAGQVLKAYEVSGTFKDFGFDSDKETQALLKDVAIYKDDDETFFNLMKRGQINQHSVGMQYIKIELAADDPDYPEEYKLYTEILPKIANFEEVEKIGYFWAVREAREFETSAVTLGSNDLTGIYDANGVKTQSKEAAEEGTLKDEPLKTKRSVYHFINY